MIENYDPYEGIGNFWGGGYSTLDTGVYNTVGDLYGYPEGRRGHNGHGWAVSRSRIPRRE